MLSVDDLTFAYEQSDPIIEGLSFSFEPGKITAVTGPSGRGKSTLLYILGLLVNPRSGAVEFNGEPVSDWPDRKRSELRAKKFGFVFQDSALDSTRSVRDNIVEGSLYSGVPRGEAKLRAAQLMEQFGVNLRADAKPGEVSGGQSARVALCRALLNSPQVILADEPTGNLDRESAAVVMSALAEAVSGGAVVIIASHDEEVVSRADVVLELGMA